MSKYLQHWGIRGMKWGIRRSREDGSVTTLVRGKRVPAVTSVRGKIVPVKTRVRNGVGIFKKKSEGPVSTDHATAAALKKKPAKQLTNDELKTLTARLQLERSYKDLSKQNVSVGKQIAIDVITKSAKTIASLYVTKYAKIGIEAAISAAIKKD